MLVKWLSLLVGPVATIAFTAIFFMIRNGQLQVSKETTSIREFVTGKTGKKSAGRTDVVSPASSIKE